MWFTSVFVALLSLPPNGIDKAPSSKPQVPVEVKKSTTAPAKSITKPDERAPINHVEKISTKTLEVRAISFEKERVIFRHVFKSTVEPDVTLKCAPADVPAGYHENWGAYDLKTGRAFEGQNFGEATGVENVASVEPLNKPSAKTVSNENALVSEEKLSGADGEPADGDTSAAIPEPVGSLPQCPPSSRVMLDKWKGEGFELGKPLSALRFGDVATGAFLVPSGNSGKIVFTVDSHRAGETEKKNAGASMDRKYALAILSVGEKEVYRQLHEVASPDAVGRELSLVRMYLNEKKDKAVVLSRLNYRNKEGARLTQFHFSPVISLAGLEVTPMRKVPELIERRSPQQKQKSSPPSSNSGCNMCSCMNSPVFLCLGLAPAVCACGSCIACSSPFSWLFGGDEEDEEDETQEQEEVPPPKNQSPEKNAQRTSVLY